MKLIGLLIATILLIAPQAWADGAGFQELKIANGSDKPLTIGIWYPTDAPTAPHPLGTFTQDVAPGAPPAKGQWPLIVMSHGAGGWYGGHYDTALALTRAGFVVAAVSHTGDTYDDQSRAIQIWGRSAHIHRLIDYMLGEWPGHEQIDAGRVGVFGFSAGGFTALATAGGVSDLTRTAAFCEAHPDYFDCQLLKKAGAAPTPEIARQIAAQLSIAHDPRIKAAVIAAPALGYTFTQEGLKTVTIPIQLWRAEDDHILPHPDYAEAVRLALPQPPEFHLVANADHFDFLAPCDARLAQLAPYVCVSRPGFDRTAFHQTFNAEVVRFFQRTLR